jgi:hypothetical protein
VNGPSFIAAYCLQYGRAALPGIGLGALGDQCAKVPAQGWERRQSTPPPWAGVPESDRSGPDAST